MCSGSYERAKPPVNPEMYKPTPEVRGAISETLEELMESPNHTVPIGRKLFGTQHYLTSGWFHDEEANRVVELKAHWLERGPVANYLLNPHRPRVSVRTVSVAHIEPVGLDDGSQRAGPYRLFFFNVPHDRIDTCEYDDYEADSNAVEGLGASEIMREHLELALQSGDDILTPQTENQLIDSLRLGHEIGWQPIQSLFES